MVDAAQGGVEAQTIANAYMAVDQELELIPVLNKIDLPSADPDKVKLEIEDIVGIDASDAILASAKDGTGGLKRFSKLSLSGFLSIQALSKTL